MGKWIIEIWVNDEWRPDSSDVFDTQEQAFQAVVGRYPISVSIESKGGPKAVRVMPVEVISA